MSEIRQHAHQLIERMPEEQITGLVKFLETIVDPAIVALSLAATDDEPESDAELTAVQEANDWLLRNGDKGVDHKEAMRRLGLE